jgi:hypothetical protein
MSDEHMREVAPIPVQHELHRDGLKDVGLGMSKDQNGRWMIDLNYHTGDGKEVKKQLISEFPKDRNPDAIDVLFQFGVYAGKPVLKEWNDSPEAARFGVTQESFLLMDSLLNKMKLTGEMPMNDGSWVKVYQHKDFKDRWIGIQTRRDGGRRMMIMENDDGAGTPKGRPDEWAHAPGSGVVFED